ncbi:hypothetical protein [Cellulomonas xylanilytica]|uniref:Uncharacterized protein n=1 Tax=Cellulomonas xylanilytica TaxID=233583 RepID=A0A510VAF2_9CELL|nr:hypothetical protein [Cellulomonas xylanilytica]GEK22230.1 hypothetical protein CXY01_27500 [Cellulomonas xylanilytica]
MPTDKTPRDADQTLALPVTDEAPTTGTTDDDTAVITEHDTVVISDGDTTVIPADDTAVLTLETAEPVEPVRPAEPVETDRSFGTSEPVADETRPYPSTTAWSSQDEPAPYTSPIGALYAPADRPDPAPSAAADPLPVVETAPADPPRRRLRVGTVVWGLVIAAIGVGLLAWAAGFAIDLQLAMIVLLAVAGTALLVGSIVSGARAARR